ncbi:unnamed protein product [Dovyalis caffra]|uniref:Uncharacterized protein n=1 Tax=Dovyalis caffra TaxID=77055 RepID=A0AAV1RGX8_9ROSI|nr:unnamed protein product [Dovyalis caffra]
MPDRNLIRPYLGSSKRVMSREPEGLGPDSAAWNSMISGDAKFGKKIEAFNFFKKLQCFQIAPGLKAITGVLQVCASISALQSGRFMGKQLELMFIRIYGYRTH